ncbi:MAG: discoidin domain-containing protein [Thomasclavelia sp.]|uniref:discoidin domain-containing protein n=1 Tax=Thomasclavelia sp. TaxID=3025757 RepID=UPI0039A25C03
MKLKSILKKMTICTMTVMMGFTCMSTLTTVKANELVMAKTTDDLGSVIKEPVVNENRVDAQLENAGLRITFYRDDVFRIYVDPTMEFADPTPNSPDHEGKMISKGEEEYINEYGAVTPQLTENNDSYEISTDSIKLLIRKSDAVMTLINKNTGEILWKEASPIKIGGSKSTQILEEQEHEYFFGGGITNGFVNQNGRKVKIEIGSYWTSGANSSPIPFYLSTKGYGVMRHTWKSGLYDFGNSDKNIVNATHNENRFDAFYFVGDTMTNVVDEYTELTGKASMMTKYGYYLAHLNCYNRDKWVENSDGTRTEYQSGKGAPANAVMESLNGQDKNGNKDEEAYKFSARAVIDDYVNNDMPLGWFLPNDGYGCGYGQSDSFEGDLQNLSDFASYAKDNGVITGLWTQQDIWPADKNNPQKGERDIVAEAKAGVSALKTDVAWVGNGYSMALDGIKTAFEAIKDHTRPSIISLDGWAGSQRYAGMWTGDQTGGNWEYIRMHIPSYITAGMSGQFNVGSDMDGIYGGGNPVVQTRDFQWKAFTPMQLDMDGWGKEDKKPWVFDEPYTSINRMYLKLKAEMLPYNYTLSREAYDSSVPMVRGMFLSDANEYTYTNKVNENQFTWGDSILVAPVYQDIASDEKGNDIRNDIYLPGEDNVWIDYFSGQQYQGGMILNGFDAPVWKTPVFVKNGAIIPMTVENNSPYELTGDEDRIYEIYPSGNTEFVQYDDQGDTEAYKLNDFTTTKITSRAPVSGDGQAVITVQPTKGDFKGMVANKATQFVVNVAKEPTKLSAQVGKEKVTLRKVTSIEEFNAGENVYYYNEAPDMNKYATEGSEFANVEIINTPKLYVKVAATDTTKNAVSLTIEDFNNTQPRVHDNQTVLPETPANLHAVDKGDTTISIAWDKVDTATMYEVQANDRIYSNITDTNFTVPNLNSVTTYQIKVRAVNSKGISSWSEPIEETTTLDIYRNKIKDMDVSVSSQSYQWPKENIIDNNNSTVWRTDYSQTDNLPAYALFDLKYVYDLDKLEYSPLNENYANAKAKDIEIQTSMDGRVFKTVKEVTCPDDESMITFDLEGVSARFVRFYIKNSYSYYSGAAEISIYKEEGSGTKVVGDYNEDGQIDESDLIFFENYAGVKEGATMWESQVKKADLNQNGYIDAYDISFVSSQIDGGIVPTRKHINGEIILEPSVKEVKKGETFTIDVMANRFADINAFNFEIPYDTSKYEVVSLPEAVDSISEMRNFSINFEKEGYLSVSFANVGNKSRINGNGKLATIEFKAKEDSIIALSGQNGLIVDSRLNTRDAFEEIRVIEGISATCAQESSPNSTKNILDGNDTTYLWSSWVNNDIMEADKEIYLDLKDIYELDSINYYRGQEYSWLWFNYADIYISEDGKDYTLFKKKVKADTTNEPAVFDISGAKGRYIKIVLPNEYLPYKYFAIADLEVVKAATK